MDYYIFGSENEIALNLIAKASKEHEYIQIKRSSEIYDDVKKFEIPNNRIGIVYLSSILVPAKFYDRSKADIFEQYKINAAIPIQLMEYLNDNCDVGFDFIYVSSESGKKGSFDSGYAITKNCVEFFIRELYLKHHESRVLCVSPSTIEDSRMTLRRDDVQRLKAYKKNHPKKRFLTASEVASVIHSLMGAEFSYLTNTTIELNGGKFARKTL